MLDGDWPRLARFRERSFRRSDKFCAAGFSNHWRNFFQLLETSAPQISNHWKWRSRAMAKKLAAMKCVNNVRRNPKELMA